RIQHVHFHTCSYSHTSAPQIYTPSLHDALPIYPARELVGIGPVDALRIADLYCGKHLEHLRPERAATPADPVDSQGFGDLIPDADRKSTRLNSSHVKNSYAVFCLKKIHKASACA